MENPVIDLIIRVKNGYMAGLPTLIMPTSTYKEAVAKKLVQLEYIKSVKTDGRSLILELLYNEHVPVLTDVKLFTKPGRRHYVSYKELKSVLGGIGYSILSTPKGILTNREARKEKVGGELLFNIW